MKGAAQVLDRIDEALKAHQWATIRDVEAWLDETAAERYAAELADADDWIYLDPNELERTDRRDAVIADVRLDHDCRPGTCTRDWWSFSPTARVWCWQGPIEVDPCCGYRVVPGSLLRSFVKAALA